MYKKNICYEHIYIYIYVYKKNEILTLIFISIKTNLRKCNRIIQLYEFCKIDQ